MKQKTLKLVAPFVFLLLACSSLLAPRQASANFWTDNLSRQSAYNAVTYFRNNTLYIDDGWTGSAAGCNAGTVSPAFTQAVLDTVNYFRSFNQLPAVSLNASHSADAQQAALMMLANNQLNHFPPNTWNCYTTAGASAAGASNLELGASGAFSIIDYMSDFGSNNVNVLGHRRWILSGALQTIGSGDTSGSNALYIDAGASPTAGAPKYAGWPAANYFPVGLAPDQWSITNPQCNVNFSGAQVTITMNGASSSKPVIQLPGGYGDNGIAWNMPYLYTSPFPDMPVQITVSGLKDTSGNPIADYSYTTILFDMFSSSSSGATTGGGTFQHSGNTGGSTTTPKKSTGSKPKATAPTPPPPPPGNTITLQASLGLTLWNGSNFGQQGQNLALSTSAATPVGIADKNNVPLALVNVNLSSAVDWSKAPITYASSSMNYKAFVHGLTDAPGVVGGAFTLYVPHASQQKYVGICPDVADLHAVEPSCPHLYYLTDGQSKTNKDSSSIPKGNTVTAKVVTINSVSYWQVDGLTGTGGFSSKTNAQPIAAVAAAATTKPRPKNHYGLYIAITAAVAILTLAATYKWWLPKIKALKASRVTALIRK
jgi:uncharacterized protein YkwD